MNLRLMFVSGLSLALAIFAMQNYEIVTLQFLFWSFKASRAIVVFLAAVIGMLIGLLAGYRRRKA